LILSEPKVTERLERAVKRGVKVRLLVPGRSDVPPASYAGRSFFRRLLKAGIEIHTYLGEMLHAKTYLFDQCWSIVGSTNLDYQSLIYNDEGKMTDACIRTWGDLRMDAIWMYVDISHQLEQFRVFHQVNLVHRDDCRDIHPVTASFTAPKPASSSAAT
jgi:hypothetical protein